MMRTAPWFWCAVAAGLLAGSAPALDWPHWRGPDYNGISRETGWRHTWPAGGPRQLWQAPVGTGFASFAVSSNRVYTTGNAQNHDTVFCFAAETGQVLWQHRYAHPLDPRFYEGGTSATPTVEGGRVYTLGKRGHLFCLEAATGKVIWAKHLTEDFGLKMPQWGFAGSPVVWNDLLLLNAGTAGLALRKDTGLPAWQSGKDAAGYASVVVFHQGQQPRAAILGAAALHVLDPATGKEAWRFPWDTKYEVNAADPIISGSRVFLSSSYGKGCALIEFGQGAPRQVYANKYMRNHFNSCVLLDGHLYGTSGESGQASYLMCMEFATGQVKWQERSVGLGALMAADGKLIVQGEKGELLIVQAAPDKFTPLARAQVLNGRCWTTPVLAHGRIYCRNAAGRVVALDVRP